MIDNKISIFKNPTFGEIRTAVDENGNIMFALKDVCDALGIANNRNVMRYMDECYVHSMDVSTPIVSQGKDTGMSKEVQMTFIGEPNLYRCIFQSRKKIAKDFQKWIFDEVLPSIRKNGGYLIAHPDDTPDQIITRALNVASVTLEQLMEQNQRLKDENTHYQAIFNTKDTVTTTEMASKFGMSAKKLNKIIGELGIQYKQNGRWFLYEAYKGLGLTDDKTYTIGEGDEARLKTSMHWTPKGIEFISNELQKIKLAN